MGVLAFVIDKISDLIGKLYDALPFFQPNFWEVVDVTGSVATIQRYINIANAIFPMSDLAIVIGLLFTYAICMFSFWVMQRLLNLVRGSG